MKIQTNYYLLFLLIFLNILNGQIISHTKVLLPSFTDVQYCNYDSSNIVFVNISSVFYLPLEEFTSINSSTPTFTANPDSKILPYTPVKNSVFLSYGTKNLIFFNSTYVNYYQYSTDSIFKHSLLDSSLELITPIKSYFAGNVLYTLARVNNGNPRYTRIKTDVNQMGTYADTDSFGNVLDIGQVFTSTTGSASDNSGFALWESSTDLVTMYLQQRMTSKSSMNVTNFIGKGATDAGRQIAYFCTKFTNNTIGIAGINYTAAANPPNTSIQIPTFSEATDCTSISVDVTKGQIFATLTTTNGSIYMMTVGVDGKNKKYFDITNQNTTNVVTGSLFSNGFVFVSRTSAHDLYQFEGPCTDQCSSRGSCEYLSCVCDFPYGGSTCNDVKLLNLTTFQVDISHDLIQINGTDLDGYSIDNITVSKGLYDFNITSFDGVTISIEYPPNITRGEILFVIGLQNGSLMLEIQPSLEKIQEIQLDSGIIKFNGKFLGDTEVYYIKDGKKSELSGCKGTFSGETWNMQCNFKPESFNGEFTLQIISGPYSSQLNYDMGESGEPSESSRVISSISLLVLIISILLL